MSNKKPIYIALDVEAAGQNILQHPTLSIGACVVSNGLNFSERQQAGLVFYSELKQRPLAIYQDEPLRIGCAQLDCLRTKKSDPRYDPTKPEFQPRLLFDLMYRASEPRLKAIQRFQQWIRQVANGREVVGVTDTVFFDSIRIALEFAKYGEGDCPFGHQGLDLTSFYCGQSIAGFEARLKDLAEAGHIFDWRTQPHKADQDAAYLADQAACLLDMDF